MKRLRIKPVANLRKFMELRYAKPLVFAGIFGAAGIAFLLAIWAATPTTSFEAESGTRTSAVSIVSDSTASAGNAVKFGSGGTSACTAAVNKPSGVDPWGGCWPGPSNTGVPAGTTLKRVPQDVTSGPGWRWVASEGTVRIESCGAVLDKLDINGGIYMRVGNGTSSPDTPCATVTKSISRGVVLIDDTGCSGWCGPIVLRDTEVVQTGSTFYSNLLYANFWMYNVNSHGGRGPSCNGPCGIYDSWVHGLYLEGSVHHNAAGTNGVGNGPFVMNHNYFVCGDFSAKDPNTNSDAGCSADIGLYGDFADLKNITISRNFLAGTQTGWGGATQAGYCLQTGIGVNKPFNHPTNLKVTDNVFARATTGRCGDFGVHSGWEAPAGSGNVWTGNKWDDGGTINP